MDGNTTRLSGFGYKHQFQPYRPTQEQRDSFHLLSHSLAQLETLDDDEEPHPTRRDKGKEKVDEWHPQQIDAQFLAQFADLPTNSTEPSLENVSSLVVYCDFRSHI